MATIIVKTVPATQGVTARIYYGYTTGYMKNIIPMDYTTDENGQAQCNVSFNPYPQYVKATILEWDKWSEIKQITSVSDVKNLPVYKSGELPPIPPPAPNYVYVETYKDHTIWVDTSTMIHISQPATVEGTLAEVRAAIDALTPTPPPPTGCFILTALGEQPLLDEARHYRDTHPGLTWLWRRYYTLAPGPAKWLQKHPLASMILRAPLKAFIKTWIKILP